MIYKIGHTFCFAKWVQDKGSLSMLCKALGAFIRRNMVTIVETMTSHEKGNNLVTLPITNPATDMSHAS